MHFNKKKHGAVEIFPQARGGMGLKDVRAGTVARPYNETNEPTWGQRRGNQRGHMWDSVGGTSNATWGTA